MSWSHPDFEAVARVVGERTGLAFAPSRCDSAEQGIGRAMRRAGVGGLDRYLALLTGDRGALDDLIVELTVGETYFFREPGQFQLLRREIVPEIVRRRGPDHTIRCWSAGCASGEEAYSLAILFARLAQEGLVNRAHILGTDISRAGLTRARQAVYADWSLRGDGADLVKPYLVSDGNRYRLDSRIRGHVTFDYLNLALDVYPSFATGTWGMDLILCRNVLIYFASHMVQNVARRLFETLADGGWLITASSDPPLTHLAPFETVVTNEGVFYRRRRVELPLPSETGYDNTVFDTAEIPRAEPEEVAGQGGSAQGTQDNHAPLEHDKAKAADDFTRARDAFAKGDYQRVVWLTESLMADTAAAALRVRALANIATAEAERACAEAAARHPLSAELAYLHAVLLLDLDRDEEAVRAVRRVIYLDRSLAIAHFALGSILRRRGDHVGARRAFRNARDLSAACPPDQAVPLGDGEPAGRLAAAAAAELALLEAPSEANP
jgi:chemotaxis protein methyltransferase CheR